MNLIRHGSVGVPRLWLLQGLLVLLYVALALLSNGSSTAVLAAASLITAALVVQLFELRPLLEFETINDLRLWQLLVIAAVMWALSWLHEAGSVLLTGATAPIPTVADLLRLAGFLAITGGLSVLPVSKGRRFGRVRDLLDVFIIFGGSLVLFYLLVIQSAMEIGIERPVMIIWASLPPAFDIALILLALRLRFLARTRLERSYFGLLALAFALRLPSDLAIGYGLIRPERVLGQLTDLGWMLSPMAVTLAARQRLIAVDAGHSIELLEANWKRIATRFESLLPPSVTYLVVGFTVVDYWLMGELNLVAGASSAVLAILLVARQGVISGQAEMRQHAALVNAAADLAFICDSDGGIVLANPAMGNAIGKAPDEPVELQLQDILADTDVPSILERAVEGGWSGEVHFLNSAGVPFPAALSLRPVPDERSYQVMLAGTAHDLTALKMREDELRLALTEVAEARQQLETLNQSLEEKVQIRTQELAETVAHLEELNEDLKALDELKSEFVTLVSHELRGPLTNIRSGVELALSRAESLPTSAEETLRLVSAETERLTSFVEIILDLSALEAGRFPLEVKAIPLAVLCRAVANRFPAEKGKRVSVEIHSDVPSVLADEQALTSVLFHLIDNALKYAPTGPVQLQAEISGDLLEISVQDHGPGIPEQEREAVFERFHRLDSRDSREIYGHGLGLYLSRQLLRAMSGEIQISGSAAGTRVVFSLPLAEEKQPHSASA